jgi:plastocyanin
MKKLFYFLALASTVLVTSCSDDDSQSNNPGAASLTVTPSATTVIVGSTVTFTVKDNLGENVTQDAVIYIDGEAIEGSSVEAAEAGTYTVHAKMGDLTSPDITVTVTENPATSITVTLSASTVGVGEAVTFTAKTNLMADVTAEAVFYVGNTAIVGHTFTPAAAGNFTVHAVFGTLTSANAALTVTAAEAEVDNAIALDSDLYTTDESLLIYLGSDTEANLSYWVANSFTEDGEGYPNDVYLYFATVQNSDTNIDFPTTGNYVLGDEAANKLYNVEIVLDYQTVVESADQVEEGQMEISSFVVSETENSWEYDYALKLTSGKLVQGNYHGDWGFYNSTEGSDRHAASGRAKVKSVSKSQLAINRANAITSLKKKK